MNKQCCKYGVFSLSAEVRPGKQFGEISAHRLAYYLNFGIDPRELWVLHRCDNPPCCNPDHLFLGTYQDNVNDMVKKNRHMHGDSHYLRKQPRFGENHNRAVLLDCQVIQIRQLYASGGITQKRLGELFSVSEYCIQKVISRKNYAHLP